MAFTFLTYAIVVIVVLGVVIFLHELGHFMAAKAFGIRVLTFSLGFGKRLFGFKRGDTDYRVSAIPLGGYVKMAGDDPTEAHGDDPAEFLFRPRWQRLVIVVMGPTMNIVMAIGILAGLYHYHFETPSYQQQAARIGDVEPGSPAAKAGIEPGDLIVRLGDLKSPKWEDVELKILVGVNESVPVEIQRDGRDLNVTITPEPRGPSRGGYAGWNPCMPGTIRSLTPGFPAGKAGLKVGDQIVALDGHKLLVWPQLISLLQDGKGKPVDLAVLRDGKELHFRLTPVPGDEQGETKWQIGVGLRSDIVVERLPWGAAIGSSVKTNIRNCVETFHVIGKILSRRMSTRSLSGPIGIAELTGEAYRAGFLELLMVVSFISLQLGIFNLLPIPVLDGGVILLLLIESLMRRDLSLGFKERFVQVGIAFLLLLAVFVMYNDIVKTIRPY